MLKSCLIHLEPEVFAVLKKESSILDFRHFAQIDQHELPGEHGNHEHDTHEQSSIDTAIERGYQPTQTNQTS